MSTLEAIARLLIDLQGSEDTMGASVEEVMLGNLRMKVDACCMQKSIEPPYASFCEDELLQYK